jgi:hypothetical protein
VTDLLRATIAPEYLPELHALEARYKALAQQLPWTDDAFNEMIALNRQMVALAVKPASEAAA